MKYTHYSALSLLLFFLLATFFTSHAQDVNLFSSAQSYLEKNRQKWALSPQDINDLVVNNQYQTDHNGVTHLFLIQRHAGIEIYNTVTGIHFKDGAVIYAANRFIPNVAEKVNVTAPTVKTNQALTKAAEHLGMAVPKSLKLTKNDNNLFETYEGGELSDSPIPVKQVFFPTRDGKLRLAWYLAIDDPRNADYWGLMVDALDGSILQKNNFTTYCNFSEKLNADPSICSDVIDGNALLEMSNSKSAPPLGANDGTYLVLPVPVESPIFGVRSLISNPANIKASPFGWHDTNGVIGAEYTTTRGNNSYAYLDTNKDNSPDTTKTEGGSNLIFNFPFSSITEPVTYQQASVTQLFYMTNIMHDFSYQYGFNEAAGNFQVNNYGKGGLGRDQVLAESQDGEGTNNANFATPPDGASGRMQMYLWSSSSGKLLNITAPKEIADLYQVSTADFGTDVNKLVKAIPGDFVLVNDGSGNPQLGCQTLINTTELKGKIALIGRGTCTFEQKAINAQAAGAIGAIIVNVDESLVGMANTSSPDPTIPVVMIRASLGKLIKESLVRGQTVTGAFQPPAASSGPAFLDASFDNGIIAHEFGHGISTRLTGGPSVNSCLFNDEQMGEGWSDFFTLITSVKPGQNGKLPRGVGNFVVRAGTSGGGIRRFPYSNDFSVNSQVFNDIIGTTSPHSLGEIWVSTLWDLYWALTDRYGWDPDLYNGKGGNNLAIQLVMDGMKLQSCNPGFIDGRDAILAADAINNNSANECLIWEVFARRGLGWNADQRSSDDRNDGTQSFDNRPECIKTLKITKTANALIQAGDSIRYELTIYNHKTQAISNVTVIDEIATNSSFISSSAKGAIKTTLSNNMVTFEVGNLAPGQSKVINYVAATNRNSRSIRQFFDGAESGISNWNVQSVEGTSKWDTTRKRPFQGQFSWFVPNAAAANQQILALRNPIKVTGKQPVLRFIHRYNIEPAYDGGIVEISSNSGASWQQIQDNQFFRESYRGPLTYSTFVAPNIYGFSGVNEYTGSYIDLGSYIGQNILIRFRYKSDQELSPNIDVRDGWYIDNIEFFDMYNYNTQACAKSAEGDQACALVAGKGTIVEPSTVTTTATTDLVQSPEIKVYPNPTGSSINVYLQGLNAKRAVLTLYTLEGKAIEQKYIDGAKGESLIYFDLSNLAAGMYLIQVKADQFLKVEKILKTE
jgi:uncharacterized repeat protein (TIGR01451 family)